MGAHLQRYEMPDLLGEGNVLVLNTQKNILTWIDELGEIREQQLLTDSERYLIETLFASYPEWCPFEELLSAMSNEEIEKSREKVLWGLNEGEIDVVMRPVRNLLSRCRVKLRPFNIEISSIQETGYLLKIYTHRPIRRMIPRR